MADTRKPGWRTLLASLRHRKTGFMFLFGFSAGLPYALLLGTLYAWLSDARIDLETMGVFSLVGLAYAFKFLWSPLVDRIQVPLLVRLGRRKAWLVPAQLLLGSIFLLLSMLQPEKSLGWFSLLAAIGAFASATQDIAIDAWRVDVADEVATLEMLSTVYQLGYRIAALVGGALALFLADLWSWPFVYMLMGATMAAIGLASLFAPDNPPIDKQKQELVLHEPGALAPWPRALALAFVGTFWAWALITVGIFMIQSLGSEPAERPDAVLFISRTGPLIVIATVIIPGIVAAILEHWRRTGKYVLGRTTATPGRLSRVVDHGYNALILPLTDIVGRLGWAAILVLALILTYRFTDTIWGTFAYPFYLGELLYTKSEVAIASKFFGVGMTMLGIAVGGALFAFLGRMATLTIGAVTAAASNLLFADLAAGGHFLGVLGQYSGFFALMDLFGADARMGRLMLAIAGENIAGGLAGAAFVAYLSSITSKKYSAVQYALLSSLTFLVGTLGRGALGQMIELSGYVSVFLLTAALGTIAVVLCLAEWLRVSRPAPSLSAGVAAEAESAGAVRPSP